MHFSWQSRRSRVWPKKYFDTPCSYLKKELCITGHGGGLVVSVLAFYSEFESRWRVQFVSATCRLERTKTNKKRPGLALFTRKNSISFCNCPKRIDSLDSYIYWNLYSFSLYIFDCRNMNSLKAVFGNIVCKLARKCHLQITNFQTLVRLQISTSVWYFLKLNLDRKCVFRDSFGQSSFQK